MACCWPSLFAGANVHDTQLIAATLNDVTIERPKPTEETSQHLCLDAAYVGDQAATVVQQHYVTHVHLRGEDWANVRSVDPIKKPRRWVVETVTFLAQSATAR